MNADEITIIVVFVLSALAAIGAGIGWGLFFRKTMKHRWPQLKRRLEKNDQMPMLEAIVGRENYITYIRKLVNERGSPGLLADGREEHDNYNIHSLHESITPLTTKDHMD
jgi:hypothetical protein